MNTPHTPGPWHVDMHQIDTATDIRCADGWILCQMSGKRTEQRDANAHLIASAPQLLSQRNELVKALQEIICDATRAKQTAIINKASAAINSVRGIQ